MSGQVLTPAGPIHLGNDEDAALVAFGSATPTTVLGTMRVLVSPALPIPPSEGEIARRIVRHGFNDAGLLPFAEGDVGPKPGDQIRALELHGALYVDAELGEQLKREGELARDRAWAEGRERARVRVELAVIAQMVGVERVVAYRVEHQLDRTLYRIPRGEDLAGDWAAEVWVDHEDLRRAGNEWQRRAYVAQRLRLELIERKLDDEEAGRGR